MSKDVKEQELKEQEEASLVLINNIFVNNISPLRAIIDNATGTARQQGGKWKVVIASGNQTQKPKYQEPYLLGVTNVPPEFPTTKMYLISVEGKFPYTFAER
jgi:hypothetical protein